MIIHDLIYAPDPPKFQQYFENVSILKVLTSLLFQGFDAPSSNTDDEASSTTRNSSNRLHHVPWKDRNASSSDQVCQEADEFIKFQT